MIIGKTFAFTEPTGAVSVACMRRFFIPTAPPVPKGHTAVAVQAETQQFLALAKRFYRDLPALYRGVIVMGFLPAKNEVDRLLLKPRGKISRKMRQLIKKSLNELGETIQ